MIKVQEREKENQIQNCRRKFFLGLTSRMRKISIRTNQIIFKDLCFTRGIFI